MLDQFDNLFWDRYKAGDLRGEPKDKVPLHGDDELDALSYIVCGPYQWTSFQPRPNIPAENLNQDSPTTAASPNASPHAVIAANRRYAHLTHNHGLSPDRVATLQQQPQTSIGRFR
jgi:hypothetical protein